MAYFCMINDEHQTLHYNSSLKFQIGKLRNWTKKTFIPMHLLIRINTGQNNELHVQGSVCFRLVNCLLIYNPWSQSNSVFASLEWSHLLLQECMLDWSTNCAANMLKLTACLSASIRKVNVSDILRNT